MEVLVSKNWVDCHFHVFESGQAVVGARYIPNYDATLEDWLSYSQAAGVTKGVFVQPSFLGVDNQLLLKTLSDQPDNLRGVVVVNPGISEPELEDLHVAGVRGIRLNLAGISHEIPEWRRADLVWETMHRLSWSLEIHTDQGGLPAVLRQLPGDLSLVIDHMAKPVDSKANDPSVSMLAQRSKSVPTWVKLSGAYRLRGVDAAKTAQLLLNELGPTSMLWGSDWPCTNHERCADYAELISAMHTWVDASLIEQVMALNPMRLYWGCET